MDQFEALSRSMGGVIRQGRLGTLVAIRLLDHTTADHGLVERNLARGIRAAWDWLGGTPEHVSAVGGVQAGQITAVIRFGSGSTALVGAGICGATSPRLDAVVVGNKGVCSWEPVGPDEASDQARQADADPSPPARVLEVMKAVRMALATGRSVSLKGATVGGLAADPAPTRGDAPAAPAQAGPSERTRKGSARSRGPGIKPPFGTLLVAGGATHQEDYARALAADPRCRLLALADEPDVSPRRKRWNEQLARELGVPVLPDLDTALARKDVSVVSICAEPERRARIILRCAEAGMHLYLDKPLAASVDEARQLVAAIERAGVVNQMFSMVHTTMATRARQVIRSGRLGDVVAVHADLLFAKGPAGSSRLGSPRVESRRPTQFERLDSKRELYNVGVYPLVFISWLLGRSVRRVSAVTANYFFREHQTNDMEDFGLLLVELDGGITASVIAGRTGWRSHPLGGVNQAILIGTRGVAAINAYRPRLEVWNDEPSWLPPRPDPEDPMGFWRSTPLRLGMTPKQGWILPDGEPPSLGDARYFLDCLEQGVSSEVDASAGAAALEVLMAAYESASTGQPVRIAPHAP